MIIRTHSFNRVTFIMNKAVKFSVTNSDFLILRSLQPKIVDLRYFKLLIMLHQLIMVHQLIMLHQLI